MRTAILSAAVLLIAASPAWAQTASRAGVPVPSRGLNSPEIIERPGPEETPQQRVLRLEAELRQAKQAAGDPFSPTGSAPALQPGMVPPTVVRPTVVVDDSWRYRQANGTWWYLQPNNRWAYWSNGYWVEYVPHVHVVPTYHYHRDYYPHYDHHSPSIGIFFGLGGHGHHRHHGHGGHGRHGHH